jgi:hypothetical protein
MEVDEHFIWRVQTQIVAVTCDDFKDRTALIVFSPLLYVLQNDQARAHYLG